MVCCSFCASRRKICYNFITMTPTDWAGLTLTILGILATVGVVMRWILKKYVEEIMSELRPNSGSSMKDQITRLEAKTDKLYDALLIHLEDHSNK